MTDNFVPKDLYENEVTQVLDKMRHDYGILTRKGFIYGMIAIDQDAKIIAIDSRFDKKLNYWDLSSVGAAMYGVARQAQDFFETDELIRGSIIFKDLQLYVRSVGNVHLPEKGQREILIILLVDSDVNIGVIILQMKKYVDRIREAIENSRKTVSRLQMTEMELKKHLLNLKQRIFQSGSS
jgi:predicted regulator of Ras-like GTPase activity (Roadblock/LC7/MglB family)